MIPISIETVVPPDTCPLEHRNRVEARTRELGWPPAHSAGTCLACDPPVAELSFDVPHNFDQVAHAIRQLRAEFDVRGVTIHD